MSGATGLSEISSLVQTRLSARPCFMFVWIQYRQLKNTDSLLWVNTWGALATSRQGVSSSKRMTERNHINSGKRISSRITQSCGEGSSISGWDRLSFTEFHHKNRKMPYLSRSRKPAPRQQDTATNTHIAEWRQVVLTFLFLKLVFPIHIYKSLLPVWEPRSPFWVTEVWLNSVLTANPVAFPSPQIRRVPFGKAFGPFEGPGWPLKSIRIIQHPDLIINGSVLPLIHGRRGHYTEKCLHHS